MAAQAQKMTKEQGWDYFLCPKDAWDAMYADCAAAKTSIHYEQYILENDEAGQRMMQLFIEKARQGLKVFIVCDQFGSASLKHSPLVEELKRVGGEFHFYHPVTWLDMLLPWRCFPRTHVKTLLIDSAITYVGGVCVAQRMRDWRDTKMRLTGPIAAHIHDAFDQLASRIAHPRRRREKISSPIGSDSFRYVLNRPLRYRHAVYQEIVQAIADAQQYISITTAYFIPNHKFFRLLEDACVRGVEVRILLPGKSDVFFADLICLSYFPRLMRAGVKLFYYQPTVLHSKSAVIDDVWATIGSTNFDLLSFFHNREANVILTEPGSIAQLRQIFADDLQDSIEITPDIWKRIPLWKKLLGYAGRSLKIVF